MEAPEKLYILFNHPYTVDYTKLNKRRCEEEVEYTRTDVCADAFIEKVVQWLKNNTDVTPTGIRNFRKAMKGE